MKKITKYVCCILALCIVSASCSNEETEAVFKNFNIRGQKYQIPSKYILLDLPVSMVPRSASMDKEEGINISIPLADLGIIPLSHEISTGNANTVNILLYGPSAFISTNEYGLNSAAWNAWTGSEQYRNREIIHDKKNNLYKVLWRTEAKSWEYFKEPPPEKWHVHVVVPKWVAGCYIWGNVSEEAKDMSNVSCTTQLSSAWGDADISFTGRYVSQTGDILEGVRKKINEWVNHHG